MHLCCTILSCRTLSGIHWPAQQGLGGSELKDSGSACRTTASLQNEHDHRRSRKTHPTLVMPPSFTGASTCTLYMLIFQIKHSVLARAQSIGCSGCYLPIQKKKGRCVLPELLGAFPTKALNDTALEESISLCLIHLQRQPLKKNNK